MIDKFEKTLRNVIFDDSPDFVETSLKASSAAVIILFHKSDGIWQILFTRRTNKVKTHQGEVSFPGGSYEEQDETLETTALRETWEEIGIPSSSVEVIGKLSPTMTISNFVVTPFVGILKKEPIVKINREEVERVFSIPVDWLMNSKNYYEKDIQIGDRFAKNVLHYNTFNGELLWGLTARITHQLIHLMQK